MDRFDPSPLIKGSEKITGTFGYWPPFHDAEILEVRMTVADGEPWVPGSESQVMEMKMHLFEMTKDVTPDGFLVLTNHTLAHLRFANVENLELSGFWHQNCIFDLEFGTVAVSYPRNHPSGKPASLLTVRIHASVGLTGGFHCRLAEVVSAEPCDERGLPKASAA